MFTPHNCIVYQIQLPKDSRYRDKNRVDLPLSFSIAYYASRVYAVPCIMHACNT